MIASDQTFHTAIFDALCACLGLSAAEGIKLIHEAYAEPENASRPVVEPALNQADLRAEMGEKLLASCEAALEGDLPETKKGLEEAGKRGADGIREYIDAGIPPPNSPVTLNGGWVYNQVAKKGVLVKGKSGATALVDTGQLRDDFDYEITEK